MVYQEMLCLPNLSVSANIFCGREICRFGRLDEARDARAHARGARSPARCAIDPDALAESLSAAHRQLLQVARALAFDCRILVLDEPTTALTDAEADHLFDVLRALKRGGTTILYVSHRLPEVFRLCDRITVLRDGAFVETFTATNVNSRRTSCRAMVGRETQPGVDPAEARQARHERGEPRLSTQSPDASGGTLPRHQSQRVGAARSSACSVSSAPAGRSCSKRSSACIVRPPARSALTARRSRSRSAARCRPRRRRAGSRRAPSAGAALQPRSPAQPRDPDRRVGGRRADQRTRGAHVKPSRMLGEWRIKAAGIDALPDSLSGGNQQKVVVGEVDGHAPRVLLLDEPTKGVDVGAKFEIHELMRAAGARAGSRCSSCRAICPEMLSLADRIVVMSEGELQGELDGAAATEEAVMRLATHEAAWAREAPARLRELSTVAILIARGVVLRVVSLARSRPRASVSQHRKRAADPQVLVDLRHRRGRRGRRDHFRRHRSVARRGDRARGCRHRPPVRRGRLAARRPASRPGCWSASASGLLTSLLIVVVQAAAVHRHARHDGHHARRRRSSSPKASTTTCRAGCRRAGGRWACRSTGWRRS